MQTGPFSNLVSQNITMSLSKVKRNKCLGIKLKRHVSSLPLKATVLHTKKKSILCNVYITYLMGVLFVDIIVFQANLKLLFVGCYMYVNIIFSIHSFARNVTPKTKSEK